MASKKKNIKDSEMWQVSLAKAIAAIVLAYFIVSLAIDRGLILAYVLSFALLYYGIHYLKETIKKII